MDGDRRTTVENDFVMEASYDFYDCHSGTIGFNNVTSFHRLKFQ